VSVLACSLADAKAQLNISDATDDAYLTSLIEDVTDWMEQYTGRYLVARTAVTVLLDTAAGSIIRVPVGVLSVTSLGIASSNQPDAGGTYTAVTVATDVVLRPPALDREPGMPATEIHLLGSTGRLVDAINGASLVGNLGPATTPDRFQRVALDAVAAAYQARRAGGTGVIGAEDSPAWPGWAAYFGWGSPQRQTLMRLRAGIGIA
jgi:hypothetical protein